MKNNKKGFTLAELLIVVAIIAVLVSIAIPVFTGQLEKARESTDLSNIRAAYAEIAADALLDETGVEPRKVQLKQLQSGWQSATKELFIGEIDVFTLPVAAGGEVIVSWVPTAGAEIGYVDIAIGDTHLNGKKAAAAPAPAAGSGD